MKCVPKWYLRLDFTFKSSKVAIFFGQISEISFQSHLIFIIQSFRNFEAGYIWKFICYEVRFGKVRFGSVKITGPVRFGKSGICLVRSTTGMCWVCMGVQCTWVCVRVRGCLHGCAWGFRPFRFGSPKLEWQSNLIVFNIGKSYVGAQNSD